MTKGYFIYRLLESLEVPKGDQGSVPQAIDSGLHCKGLCAGVVAGLGDAAINYPWTAMKIMYQRGQPVDLRPWVTPPRMWYLGVKSYAASIVPTTAIQFIANSKLKDALKPSGPWQHLGVAMASGAVGAVFSNGVEHLILGKQQKAVNAMCTYSTAIRGLHKAHGKFWPLVGYLPTAGRDAVYAGGMLYGVDWVRAQLPVGMQQPYLPVADVMVGTLASLFTQPLDVLARSQQMTPGQSVVAATRSIMQRPDWLKLFYTGGACRTMSVVSGITVMSRIRRWLEGDAAGIDPIDSGLSAPPRRPSACSVAEPKETTKYTPTLKESIQIGCVAGTAELFPWGHALWILKTRSQLKYEFTFNLEVLTRGLGYSWAAEMGLTTVQIAVANMVLSQIPEADRYTTSSQFVSAALGGAASTLFSTPADLGLTKQQGKAGQTFPQVISAIYRERGVRGLFQGGAANVVRESIYAGGFFALAPWFHDQCSRHLEVNDMALLIASGLGAGMASAVVSHPADVVMVRQQEAPRPIPAKVILSDVVRQDGYLGIFKGSFWRMARVTSATCVVSVVNEHMKRYYGDQCKPSSLV